MSEPILQALMQLFAFGASLERETTQCRDTVESFLRKQVSLNRVQEYLLLFDEFLRRFTGTDDATRSKKKIAGGSVRMLRICTEINKELNTRQKYIVFLRLAEFMQSADVSITGEEREFLETVANVFTIDSEESALYLALTAKEISPSKCDAVSILVAAAHPLPDLQRAHQITRDDIAGQMIFMHVKRAQVIFMRYTGQDTLTVNGQPTDSSRVTVLAQGAVIRGQKMQPLYYSNIIKSFLSSRRQEEFIFSVQDLEYVFPNGRKGIQGLSFTTESGTLAGIMGSSGAGKSTLLGILNGTLPPSSGKIMLNGFELFEDDLNQKGVIGNIPQDDLLIEELTVFQNLYYNTKLCFGNLTDREICDKVNSVLDSLGLVESKDLRVGNALNKTISGGQRKRLNIGLELVREPSILFVDEPTSGLSSRDAENVMDLLKQLALSGKLVFVVIHQPSSDIFRMFDQLLMLDTGGYPVYFGNPSDAMIYFKRQVHLTDSEQSECPVCGNINPEQLFNIIELHEVDEFGNSTAARRITPTEWYSLFTKTRKAYNPPKIRPYTPPGFRKATLFKQWKIFFTRDLIAKLSNRQYMLINLLEAPLLALILGFILRNSSSEKYSLISNPNLPAYIFIGVIVALFLGLSVSAEEILRDRKIRQREKFLNLSRFGYLMSKVCLLFIISAIQSASFVLIGNLLMGVHEMNFTYWLILFSTSCFANLLGLNISSALDSAVTVYILIPFLLIPQILLSGVIVRFEKLHPAITTQEGVPFIGNVMTSRWAYEALAVEQFSNNPFERQFFDLDAAMSRATYKKDWWIPALRERIDKCEHLMMINAPADSFQIPLAVLKNGIKEEAPLHDKPVFPDVAKLDKNNMNVALVKQIQSQLELLRDFYIDQFNATNERKEMLIQRLTATPERAAAFALTKSRFENESLEDMVKNSNIRERLVVTNKKIIQRFEPVFHKNPEERFFQAPLFSSEKNLSGKTLSTFSANLMIIWLMTLSLYILLHVDAFRKIIRLFNRKAN